jgi:hypothetical protein
MADNERKICRIKKYSRTLQPCLREKIKDGEKIIMKKMMYNVGNDDGCEDSKNAQGIRMFNLTHFNGGG